jgi:hypothetical protein
MAALDRPIATAAWAAQVSVRLDADDFPEWCQVWVRDSHLLAWVDAREGEPAALPEQRNLAARLERRQPDAPRQIAPLMVVRGAAVAEVVDQEPEHRAWVRHRPALESKDEVARPAADSEAQRVEPQTRPPQELRSQRPEQESAFSVQPGLVQPLPEALQERSRKAVEQRQLAQLPVQVQRAPASAPEERSQPAQVRPELPPRGLVRRVPPPASSAQLSRQHPLRLCQP